MLLLQNVSIADPQDHLPLVSVPAALQHKSRIHRSSKSRLYVFFCLCLVHLLVQLSRTRHLGTFSGHSPNFLVLWLATHVESCNYSPTDYLFAFHLALRAAIHLCTVLPLSVL